MLIGETTKNLTRFLLDIAPKFCWCTGKDLFLMIEQEFQDADYHCFMSTLGVLAKRGEFNVKFGYPRMYLRRV